MATPSICCSNSKPWLLLIPLQFSSTRNYLQALLALLPKHAMDMLPPLYLPYHVPNPVHQQFCLDYSNCLPTSVLIYTSVLLTTLNATVHLTRCGQSHPFSTSLCMSLPYLRQIYNPYKPPQITRPCLILQLHLLWLVCFITLSFFLFLEHRSQFPLRVSQLAIPSGWNALFQIFPWLFPFIKSQVNCQPSPL